MQFIYAGEPRDYPSLARTVHDGDVVEVETNPDPERFAPAEKKEAKK